MRSTAGIVLPLIIAAALGWLGEPRVEADEIERIEADVIIAGGSTAALAAALAAADEGAITVLLEPTDWIGGQLTSSGVPAVDEAWHQIKDESGNVLIDVRGIARDPRNMTPAFRDMLLEIGNPGRGWVSRFCFEPKMLLKEFLGPWEQRLASKLTVFRNTVVKQVELDRDAGRVLSLTAIQRTPRADIPWVGYDQLPSKDLPDWYSREDSPRFTKRVVRFAGRTNAGSVFVDATEWGELLALSGALYLQGVDTTDGGRQGNERCGQSTVFDFVQELHDGPVDDPAPPVNPDDTMGFGDYAERPDAWSLVWTYRRIRSSDQEPRPGDRSLQNWGYSTELGHGGNDYPFGYLFLPKEATARSVGDWRGGVDLQVMSAAEQRAYAWHHWFKQQVVSPFQPSQVALSLEVLGTGHGLAKLPYVRDTRRSVGLGGFVLRLADLTPSDGSQTGTVFFDRIALGAYPADVHLLTCCKYPPHVHIHEDTAPFYLPFRALTHAELRNLLVAGKTMAQSFMANSATRLHPIEWSSGTAAGVAAAWMANNQSDSAAALRAIEVIRKLVSARTPTDWNLHNLDEE